MKTGFKTAWLLGAGGSVLLAALVSRSQPSPPPAPAGPPGLEDLAREIAALRGEVGRLKELVPDQAHAMEDVGYHFANLWFAAERKNWPLADFYLAETRSHLRWAVRIRPVRQTKAGDVDLKGLLDAVDGTEGVMLSAVKRAIDEHNPAAFTNAYRQTLEGCYTCHKASEKPFLRPQVPTQLAEHIINLDPEAISPR